MDRFYYTSIYQKQDNEKALKVTIGTLTNGKSGVISTYISKVSFLDIDVIETIYELDDGNITKIKVIIDRVMYEKLSFSDYFNGYSYIKADDEDLIILEKNINKGVDKIKLTKVVKKVAIKFYDFVKEYMFEAYKELDNKKKAGS